jgi:hypothetical protein
MMQGVRVGALEREVELWHVAALDLACTINHVRRFEAYGKIASQL